MNPHQADQWYITLLALSFLIVIISGGYLLYIERVRGDYYKLMYEDAALIISEQNK